MFLFKILILCVIAFWSIIITEYYFAFHKKNIPWIFKGYTSCCDLIWMSCSFYLSVLPKNLPSPRCDITTSKFKLEIIWKAFCIELQKCNILVVSQNNYWPGVIFRCHSAMRQISIWMTLCQVNMAIELFRSLSCLKCILDVHRSFLRSFIWWWGLWKATEWWSTSTHNEK